MPIADEIREAVQAAKAASVTPPDNPFRRILDEVAEGLTDESVKAQFTSGPGGRWTLWLSPAHRPGRAFPMVSVVISPTGAEVLLQPKRQAAKPAELAEILKGFVTMPEFLESLQVTADLVGQPVEGFLRVAPRTVTRDDLMLEVTPQQQRDIAEHAGADIELGLRVSNFPGAGKFKTEAAYKVLESAGYTVTLSEPVTKDEAGLLRITGRVQRTASP